MEGGKGKQAATVDWNETVGLQQSRWTQPGLPLDGLPTRLYVRPGGRAKRRARRPRSSRVVATALVVALDLRNRPERFQALDLATPKPGTVFPVATPSG